MENQVPGAQISVQTTERSAGVCEQAGGQPYSEPLRYKTARAALTSGGAEVVTRVLTIVLSIVTARVLEPLEVGLLGLAVIVIGVVSMLGFYPETAAVAARNEGSDHQYAMAATAIRAAITALLLGGLWLGFPLIAQYLAAKEDGVAPLRALISVLSWLPVLELLSGYPQVIMQRRLELGFIARLQVLQPVIFVGLAVGLLLNGYGYIGVAWANVASALVTMVLLWWRLLSKKRDLRGGWPSRQVAGETWRGTAKVFVGGFGGYVGGRVDNLLVSGAIGPAAMSFYSMAWNASRIPANVFARAINFVLVPALARIQNDPPRVQRALKECISNSYLMLAPACALLFVTAPFLVTYVIGPKWLPLVPGLRVMCFTVLASPILFSCAALLTGTGRAHLIGFATAVQLTALAGTIPYLSTRWGVLGAAYADLIAVALLSLTLAITAQVATRQMNWSLLRAGGLPILAAIASAGIASVASNWLTSQPARFAVQVCVTTLGYVLITAVLGGRAKLVDLTSLLRTLARQTPVTLESQT